MAELSISAGRPLAAARSAARPHRAWLPVVTVLAVLAAVWYAAALGLNASRAAQDLDRTGREWAWTDLAGRAWSMPRPVLPAPHQIAAELYAGVTGSSFTSPRNLLRHTAITFVTAAAGFGLALAVGIGLAIAIVRVRFLGRALLPWIVGAQAVPVLATAPIIIVVLRQAGIEGLLPRAIIAASSAFFPVAIAAVIGLRSADRLQLDLMATYSAPPRAVLAKLRWPSALPFLFPGLKVAAALAVVGAIVGELPTGAQAGLGARMLIGSYNGLILMMWAVLVLAAALAVLSVGVVGLAERAVRCRRGGRL